MDFDNSEQVNALAKLPPIPTPDVPALIPHMDFLTYALIAIAIQAGLCAARSVRGGFSGKLGTYLALPAQIALVAAIALCAVLVGWWTVAAFVLASIVAGVLVGRESLAWWVHTQPAWFALTIIPTAAAWGVHLLT
jgi:hypothetical protein